MPDPLRREAHSLSARLLLLASKVSTDRDDVVVKARSMRFTVLSHLLDDWVFPHRYSPASSSGVQITGST
jgi:hypothetical protein